MVILTKRLKSHEHACTPKPTRTDLVQLLPIEFARGQFQQNTQSIEAVNSLVWAQVI